MKVNMRREQRNPSKKTYSISWPDESGLTHSAEVQGLNISQSGVEILCSVEVRSGTPVYIQAQGGHPTGYSVVRHCTRREDGYLIGLELDQATKKTGEALPTHSATDHYEFLQISPNAQLETIHRVYRFLAARFHPDNPETGDPEKFLLLNRAFDVLSDPEQRPSTTPSFEASKANRTRSSSQSIFSMALRAR
ncbi:MAG: J domain-containing protein [Bryobacteraceae bacterium]